jgi:hypothetical protein
MPTRPATAASARTAPSAACMFDSASLKPLLGVPLATAAPDRWWRSPAVQGAGTGCRQLQQQLAVFTWSPSFTGRRTDSCPMMSAADLGLGAGHGSCQGARTREVMSSTRNVARNCTDVTPAPAARGFTHIAISRHEHRCAESDPQPFLVCGFMEAYLALLLRRARHSLWPRTRVSVASAREFRPGPDTSGPLPGSAGAAPGHSMSSRIVADSHVVTSAASAARYVFGGGPLGGPRARPLPAPRPFSRLREAAAPRAPRPPRFAAPPRSRRILGGPSHRARSRQRLLASVRPCR